MIEALDRQNRISLRSMFAATAVIASLLGIWRAFYYQPPTHKYPAYENANPVARLIAHVGSNTVALASVSRNRFDGGIDRENGRGVRLARTVPNQAVLSSCSQWLDVAQIEFAIDPSLVEILEARVFDHRSRTLLTELDKSFGWQMVGPNLLQVYGLGKKLPERLDIWLRAHSYKSDDEVLILEPEKNAQAFFRDATFTLNSIVDRSANLFSTPPPIEPFRYVDSCQISLVSKRSDDPKETRYEIAAIADDGTRHVHDRHVDLEITGDGEALTFEFLLAGPVDRFQLRPYGGGHRFFFEAVELPKAGNRPFAPAPTVRMPLQEGAVRQVLDEFAPLQISLAAADETRALAFEPSGLARQHYRSRGAASDSDVLTVSYCIAGLPQRPLVIRYLDAVTNLYLPQVNLNPEVQMAQKEPHTSMAQTYYVPGAGRIGAIEVSMPASP